MLVVICSFYVNDMRLGHMFDVGHDVSWARNDRAFSRYWRTELDQDMIDRADMVKELL